MHPRHESARRHRDTSYRAVLLVAAVVVTASATTSCTNLAATPTTAPAPLPSTTTAAPPMTLTAGVGPSSIGISPAGGGAFPMPPSGACHLGSMAGQPMPDERCTPGSTNAAVSQGTIHETICKSGWTATVRPPVAVTDAIKAQSARAYGIAVGELDHKIALEAGGDPGNAADVANLWFEPGPIPTPKDTVERVLNHATCAGLITLATAQTVIHHSWPTAVTDAGLQLANGRVCLRAAPAGAPGHNHNEQGPQTTPPSTAPRRLPWMSIVPLTCMSILT